MEQPQVTPKRIIVRGLNWLGDAVMSTPALQRLRQGFSDASITLCTPEKLADLWRGHPDLDDVITFGPAAGMFSIAKRIRDFDVALIFPNSPRSALEVFRVPRRYGISRPWRDFLLTNIITVPREELPMRKKPAAEVRRLVSARVPQSRAIYPPSAHHSYRYLHIAGALGASAEPCPPRLSVAAHEVKEAREKFSVANHRAPLLLGFNPGAEYGPAKRWPIERFIETARELHAQTSAVCWVFGGNADRDSAGHFVEQLRQKDVPARSLAGETSLRELCAALKACSVVITNDTGPMHVAAAVGTPVIVPFGSTSPELTGPGFPGENGHTVLAGNAPCAPCFRRTCPIDLRCLKDVSVRQVVDAAMAAVRAKPRAESY